MSNKTQSNVKVTFVGRKNPEDEKASSEEFNYFVDHTQSDKPLSLNEIIDGTLTESARQSTLDPKTISIINFQFGLWDHEEVEVEDKKKETPQTS